jgi:hypothetical protein
VANLIQPQGISYMEREEGRYREREREIERGRG